MDIEYYKILGINKNSSYKDIHKAFIGKVKLYHPDVSGIKDEEFFKKIKEAYEYLKHNHKEKFKTNNNYIGSNIFKQIEVNINESHYGEINYILNIEYKDICDKCDLFSGQMPICNICEGNGEIVKKFDAKIGKYEIKEKIICNFCNGLGFIQNHCECDQGIKKYNDTINIKIPRGVLSKDSVVLQNKGNRDHFLCKERGNLIISFKVITEDNSFLIDSNLYKNIYISHLDTYLGKNIDIQVLKNDISFKVPSGNIKDLILNGFGYYNKEKQINGDLHVVIYYKEPLIYSEAHKQAIETLIEMEKNLC